MTEKALTLKGLEKDVNDRLEYVEWLGNLAVMASIAALKTQRDQNANIIAAAYEEEYAAGTEEEYARKKA